MRHTLFLALLWVALLPTVLPAQSEVAAEPIVGLRENPVAGFAFVNAEVVVAPGQMITDATVLVEGTSITAVGQQLAIPEGYQEIDCEGKRIYPGLIDAWSEIDVTVNESPPGYWNGNVTPQMRAVSSIARVPDAAKLRSQGITARLVAPKGGIVKGSSCLMLTGEESAGRSLLLEDAWQHLQLTVPRGGSRAKYPNSPMGAVALLRQSFYDAAWYEDAWNAYTATPELDRPDKNVALQALSEAIKTGTFLIDAPNERMAIRADDLAREFSLQTILRGSGREYRQLDEIVATNRPLLVPVDFPDTPDVKTADAARDVTLQELMHWELAPENPGRLVRAGVKICLTTDGLDDVGQFLKQVRVAVERGLDEDEALAAVTVVPAELLGVESEVGRIEPGMVANLTITDGNLFAETTKVAECWVAGKRFVIDGNPQTEFPELAGNWEFAVRHPSVRNMRLLLELEGSDGKLNGAVRSGESAPKPVKAKQRKKEKNKQKDIDKVAASKLRDVVQQRDRFTANFDLREIDERLPDGISQLTIITMQSDDEDATLVASLKLPGGETQNLLMVRSDDDQESDQAVVSTTKVGKQDQSEESSLATADPQGAVIDTDQPPETYSEVRFPFGAFGASSRIAGQTTVLFRNATVWTCDEAGKLENADVLIRDGLIAKIGSDIKPPADCQVIDASGKHITPGLIDCHSHMGTDGGVNESGQAVTSEVRIGDFIDNSDIQIYRQLAGGLTTSNILHGSANPIGGQNQVIKLRWSETMDGLKMKEAPQGIKFALGENVKRNQSRYPNTRMGVEQIIRDQLLAAREYQAKWRRWKNGQHDTLPPRVDLQLQALSEVQNGTRWIHCHSYRQDEIMATLDVLDEFGIQIGTLQHILEGYKVADRMAQHGAMGSSFSDWWAYKFEVFDAIPYNGALMHDRGVVVSFNSDDRELARHLNTEAAKATKYGGVPEIEALKFVTLNPAKQLRIDEYVGSLRVGKHADIVVWSGRPLSTLTRCEQTWIDGRRYFDLEGDKELQSRDRKVRARLVQKALNSKRGAKKKTPEEISEEDRWVRHDVHCAAHGSHEYDYTENLQK
ncbi:MAG: amidohydrolase family protein [Rubripirellula sp.]|nr:amidohydrolase family protein [Rubripirellula sp.]